MNKNRLTDMEIQAIKDKVIHKADCTENNSRHKGNPSAESDENYAPVENDEVAAHNDKDNLMIPVCRRPLSTPMMEMKLK